LIRIAAVADLHLGMSFHAYPEASSLLAEARFAALERVVAEANEAEAELLVIAGDLFDRPRVAEAAVRRSVSILASFEGALVAVLPGNHDYFEDADSPPWRSFRDAVDEVKAPVLLLTEPRLYELGGFGLDAAILSGPCNSKHRDANAIGWAAGQSSPVALDATTIVIGVAHGSIDGISPDPDGRYYPMKRSDFARTAASVWIVGHTHIPTHVATRSGQDLYVPGTPEPDGFDYSGSGSFRLIDATPEGASLSRSVDCGRYRFIEEPRRISSDADLDELESRLVALEPETTLVKLVVSGTLSADSFKRYLALEREWGRRFVCFRSDSDGLRAEMTMRTVDERYPADSFPHRLLATLLDEGDVEAAEIAAGLLEELAGERS
jgi:DNA repair protein SbcD/Mre11